MQGWWLSWYNGAPLTEFELHSPWWVSGYDSEANEILVAAVRAETEHAAKEQILRAYDHYAPGSLRWRFCEPLERETPFSDRFPQSAEWMVWDEQGTCQCVAQHGGPR